MAAAWRAHPTHYLLAYRIGERLWGTSDDRLGEMLMWARVAVALRPDSPFAHTLLATAWRGMRNWGEAEASSRRAIELSRNHPRYAGAHVSLGNVLLQKGDLDGAEASYRAALAIDPDTAPVYFNLGMVRKQRGDLEGAERWYRKSLDVDPTRTYYREVLDEVVRQRARLEELAAGRADPASSAEGLEFAELVSRLPRRRYVAAVRLYGWAFAADPALAGTFPHRYNAACLALRAAAGQDEEMTTFGVEEWGYLSGLALKWLRAELGRVAANAKDPKRRQEVREELAHWKRDGDLTSVRDPEWLAAMPPADRRAWQALWDDVNGLLASIGR
jgi:tetratricopeptide (TPR) repeat protein